MNDEALPPKRRGRPPSGGKEAILTATLELLRERGIANLTSREVAARAGVSDASVYYHYGDRFGLLQAVFETSMKPFQFVEAAEGATLTLREALDAGFASLEQFFDDILPVFISAQSDNELSQWLDTYVDAHDLGPHKGVEGFGGFLRGLQQAGEVAAGIDLEAVALMLIDAAFARSVRRQMLAHSEERLPSPDRVLDMIERLLDPPR